MAMPSKSDIQFGKIVVTNHFATKEEIEEAIKSQAHFERVRNTIILEAILLYRDILTLEQAEAIQNKMKRRVIFCSKCHGKFNVHQFRGSERFLCHKCGNRVTVPNQEQYRSALNDLASKAKAFFDDGPADEASNTPRQVRETIVVRREDIEEAKKAPDASPEEEDILEPAEDVEAAIEEEEVEAEIESELEEDSGEGPIPVPDEPFMDESPAPLEAEPPEQEEEDIPEAKPAGKPKKPAARKGSTDAKNLKIRGIKGKKPRKPAKRGEAEGKERPNLRKKEPREGKPKLRKKR